MHWWVPADRPNLRLGSRKGTNCPKWEVQASRCSIVGEHAQSGARRVTWALARGHRAAWLRVGSSRGARSRGDSGHRGICGAHLPWGRRTPGRVGLPRNRPLDHETRANGGIILAGGVAPKAPLGRRFEGHLCKRVVLPPGAWCCLGHSAMLPDVMAVRGSRTLAGNPPFTRSYRESSLHSGLPGILPERPALLDAIGAHPVLEPVLPLAGNQAVERLP
jgi:hypothetical protein